MESAAPLWWVALGLLALGAVLSALLARREPGHHHIARGALLGANVVAEVVQRIARAHLRPIPPPYDGIDRAAYHVTQVLFLAWPAGVAALAVWTLARRSPGPLAALWGIAALAVCGAYPALRGNSLEALYRFLHVAAFGIGILSFVIYAWKRPYPLLEHACALMLVVGELVVLAGAYTLGVWHYWEDAAQPTYAITFGALVVLQARQLWKYRLRRSLAA